MNKEDIIRMAREAGLSPVDFPKTEELERFAALVRADELEACERAVGIALLDAEIGLAKRVFRVIRARSRS